MFVGMWVCLWLGARKRDVGIWSLTLRYHPLFWNVAFMTSCGLPPVLFSSVTFMGDPAEFSWPEVAQSPSSFFFFSAQWPLSLQAFGWVCSWLNGLTWPCRCFRNCEGGEWMALIFFSSHWGLTETHHIPAHGSFKLLFSAKWPTITVILLLLDSREICIKRIKTAW